MSGASVAEAVVSERRQAGSTVAADRRHVEIVAKSGSAYLVSAAEYEALQETAHLLRSPANARRLLRSYQEALDGRREHHELIDAEGSR